MLLTQSFYKNETMLHLMLTTM